MYQYLKTEKFLPHSKHRVFQYKDKLVHAVRGSNVCLFIVRIIHLQYVGKMQSILQCQAGGIYS